MNYYFSICSTAKYQEKYIDFLLGHYTQLNLPYPFPVTLSYIASPILMTKDAILCFDDNDEIVGAIGLIHGTGENNYQDSSIIQIQTIYIVDKYQRSRLFLKAYQYVMQYFAQLPDPVTELRFWIPAQDDLRRLCSRFAHNISVQETSFGVIEEYRGLFTDCHALAMKYPHELYFV